MPVTTKIPEPMEAPIPRSISWTNPRLRTSRRFPAPWLEGIFLRRADDRREEKKTDTDWGDEEEEALPISNLVLSFAFFPGRLISSSSCSLSPSLCKYMNWCGRYSLSLSLSLSLISCRETNCHHRRACS